MFTSHAASSTVFADHLARGVRTLPACSTRIVISYAMRSGSESESAEASTARLDPSLIAMITRIPRSMATRVWVSRAALEHPGGPLRQAGEAGGDRREVLHAIGPYPVGHRQGNPVRGHNDSVCHIGDTLGKVRDEPAKILRLVTCRIQCTPLSEVFLHCCGPGGAASR